MLSELFSNKKIWTILMTLLLLFTIVTGLKCMGLYEGMTSGPDVAEAIPTVASEEKQIATNYNF